MSIKLPEQYFSRHSVSRVLEAVGSAQLGLPSLRTWFTPVLADVEYPGPGADEDLVTRLAFMFEDDSVPEDEHRINAAGLAAILASTMNNSDVLDALPLYLIRHRLCAIVQKVTDGVIGRTSFVSFVAEAKLTRKQKEWLSDAQPRDLATLCAALQKGDLPVVQLLVAS